ncbi:hypothetical protein GWI33_006291, partial [Rhynchophorus ferrugineus]
PPLTRPSAADPENRGHWNGDVFLKPDQEGFLSPLPTRKNGRAGPASRILIGRKKFAAPHLIKETLEFYRYPNFELHKSSGPRPDGGGRLWENRAAVVFPSCTLLPLPRNTNRLLPPPLQAPLRGERKVGVCMNNPFIYERKKSLIGR